MHDAMISVVKTAAECVISSAWQGIVLVAAVTLLLRPLRGMSATARFFVWSAVSILLLVVPFLPFSHTATAAPVSPSVEPRFALPAFCAWAVAAVWATLSIYRAAQLVRSAHHVKRVCRESHPLDAIQRERFTLPETTLDRIATSHLVDVPCVAGFLHPRVLIPDTLIEAMPATELAQIVRHELEHLRRGDHWLNLLQKLFLVLFPLNPALWWAERHLCAERELACDDRVLAETRAPRDYALSLTNLAELSLARHTAILMLGAWRKHSELSVRVHRILSARSHWRSASTTGAAAVLTLLIAGAGILLGRAPAIVSFADVSPVAHAHPVAVDVAANVHPAIRPDVTPHPAPRQSHPVHVAKLHRPDPALVTSQLALAQPEPAAIAVGSGKIQLASYSKPAKNAPQPVLLEDGQHTYAAFHLVDGWLLIQL
jgi:beta-lactamase regulating signal transducer with metallopeptidase domain